MIDVVLRQTVDPEQMTVRERGLGGASVHEPETIGSVLPQDNNDRSCPCSGANPTDDPFGHSFCQPHEDAVQRREHRIRCMGALFHGYDRADPYGVGTLPREWCGITSGRNESFVMGDQQPDASLRDLCFASGRHRQGRRVHHLQAPLAEVYAKVPCLRAGQNGTRFSVLSGQRSIMQEKPVKRIS